MRLNMDCVRDILLCVEEHTGLRKSCRFVDSNSSEIAEFLGIEESLPDYQQDLLEKYDNDTLIYHVNYCIRADLIIPLQASDANSIIIQDLTISGHNFLCDIREHQNWKTIKKIAGNIGSTSLSSFTSIASDVISNLIKTQITG
ncbi:MAG TPA: DUF2513 domain-containing protein [Candidatus Anaerotignum merdipullorum]|nr:DUF2513 domain-containing protein [Candidatus Anaerotignum merdipullorum]